MNTKVKGYILGIVAAATYGMNPLFALPLYSEGMGANSVLFFRYLFAVPIMGAMLKYRGHNFAVSAGDLMALAAFGIICALSSLALFESYNYMDAGIASTLLFVYPIMVALIMSLAFKEKLTVQTVLCIGMALGGIGLLYKAADGATLSLTGTLLVFASSLSYALYIVYINRSRVSRLPTLKITFYVLLFGWMVFAAKACGSGRIDTPEPWYMWGNLIALALFPTAISFLCTTSAIHSIGSTPTAILGAFEPVTAVIFGVTVFGETLTVREVTGLGLIIVAVSLVVAGSRIPQYLVRLRKMFPRIRRK